MSAPYSYPVTDLQQALAVTEPEFEPELFDGPHPLYVNFDAVRGDRFRNRIRKSLGLPDGVQELNRTTNSYPKVIFTGHRGCGKTTELRRLHDDLRGPERYFSVFLSLEDEIDLGTFQAADFFVWLILVLVRTLEREGLEVGTAAFDNLAQLLLAKEEVTKELKNSFDTELSAEAGGGFNWLVKFALAGKAVFAGSNTTSKTIRQEVQRNTLDLINQLSDALANVRDAVQTQNRGRDLLIIVDGSEKVRMEVYRELFVDNPAPLQALNVNMVLSVPINTAYQIDSAASNTSFPNRQQLPMIKLSLNPQDPSNLRFREVVEKRINVAKFLEPGVLDQCVAVSGGCMRQLLLVVNAVILEALGERATAADADFAIRELGRRMYESLLPEQLKLLHAGRASWHPGNPDVGKMLLYLVLFKYNGVDSQEINPLLLPFLTPADAQPATA